MPKSQRSSRRLDPQKIIDRRLRLGLNQGEAAKRASMSQSMLCDIEAGRRQGSPALRKQLAEALGVRRVSDLYAAKDAAA